LFGSAIDYLILLIKKKVVIVRVKLIVREKRGIFFLSEVCGGKKCVVLNLESWKLSMIQKRRNREFFVQDKIGGRSSRDNTKKKYMVDFGHVIFCFIF